MDTTTKDLLVENAYIDVQEWLLSLDRAPVDADFTTVPSTLGIDLVKGSLFFVQTFSGNNSFMQSLKGQMVRKGTLTIPQMRAALKVLRDLLLKGHIKIAHREGRAAPIKLVENPKPHDPSIATTAPEAGQDDRDTEHRYECYSCHKWFTSYDAVMAHRAVVHYRGTKAVAVLKDAEVEETLLDLSALPDGRYAINDPKGVNDFIFLAVRTIKKRTYRDRKYRYGKFRIGHEWIEAGTIEVRLWSTDSKKLVGAQKPSEGYRGEFVDSLVAIMGAPQAWALVFAAMIGACSICGKTLTDDNSRELGIGPECFKQWGHHYWTKYNRKAAVERALAEYAKAGASS